MTHPNRQLEEQVTILTKENLEIRFKRAALTKENLGLRTRNEGLLEERKAVENCLRSEIAELLIQRTTADNKIDSQFATLGQLEQVISHYESGKENTQEVRARVWLECVKGYIASSEINVILDEVFSSADAILSQYEERFLVNDK